MPDGAVALHKLTDIEVETVGLVTAGANQEKFFLLKSLRQEADMKNETPNEGQTPELVGQEDRLAAKVLEGLRKWFKSEPAAETPPELDEVTKSVQLQKDLEAAQAQIAKANQEAAKASQEAEALRKAVVAERTAREQQVWIEKAAALVTLPVKAAELGEQLYFIQQTDPARGLYWETLLKAVDAQLRDNPLFVEAGTSQSITRTDAELDKILKADSPEAMRAAYLELGAKRGQELLRERRRTIRTG